MMLGRRGLFRLGASFVAAPAIVRVSSLMPLSVLPEGLTIKKLLAAMDALDASVVEPPRWMVVRRHEWIKLWDEVVAETWPETQRVTFDA